MAGNLTYSSIILQYTGQRLWTYVKEAIRDIPRVLKASWQRATRGWAYCDAWSIDSWFCEVVPDMLRQLADNSCGIPLDYEKCPNAWCAKLREIADDLDALNRHEEKWFGADGIYDNSLIEQCNKEEIEAEELVLRGLGSFREDFFRLWD